MVKEEEIIAYLIKKYDPSVILLGGSRAKNTQRLTSDWDLYLIGEYNLENETISEEFEGEFLDIALFPKDSLKNNVLKIYYGPLSILKILKDDHNNLGKQILEATQKAYAEGPNISKEYKLDKIVYLNRVLSKIIGYSQDPVIRFFHLAQFYRDLFPFWFELEKKWSLPVQQAIIEIKTKDLIFYDLILSLINETKIETKIRICKEILDHLNKKIK